MNCPNCGTALAEGAHFCPNCGTQIAAAPGTPPRATQGSSARSEPAPTPGSGAYAGPPATSGASADAGQPAPSGAPSARSRAPLIAAAAVAAVLALAVIGGLVLWSRGGDDEARFDPVRADELAKSAMISTSDLPGQGWQQEDKDPDEGRASELFGEESDPACRSISERLDAVRRQNEADRAGEAVREFDLADPSPTSLDASMRVSVAIFRTGNGLDKALDEVRGALADRSMPACFEDIFGGSGNAPVGRASRRSRSRLMPRRHGAVSLRRSSWRCACRPVRDRRRRRRRRAWSSTTGATATRA